MNVKSILSITVSNRLHLFFIRKSLFHRKNSFAGSKNLARHKSENIFIINHYVNNYVMLQKILTF